MPFQASIKIALDHPRGAQETRPLGRLPVNSFTQALGWMQEVYTPGSHWTKSGYFRDSGFTVLSFEITYIPNLRT